MSTADELKDQGIARYQSKRYEDARRDFQAAAEQYTAAGQPDMAAEMLSNIGLVHRALDEHQQALDAFSEALRTFQDLNDLPRSAQVLGNMGGVFAELKDREQAYMCYRQAAEAFSEIGDNKKYGETLIALAELQMKDGKIMEGAALYEEALKHGEDLNARQKFARWAMSLRGRFT